MRARSRSDPTAGLAVTRASRIEEVRSISDRHAIVRQGDGRRPKRHPLVAPKGKALEAQLDVVCRNAKEAAIVLAQFQKVTIVLRELIEKEQRKPGPADLASVLTAGVFRQDDTRVAGRWPIERAFLEQLAGK